MAIERMCSSCGRSFPRYNSAQRLCSLCQFNKYQKPRKPLKRLGRIGKALIDQKRQWVIDNPPDEYGNYRCYICLNPVHLDYMNLEHVKSKARRPDLRFDKSNLRPSCSSCNEIKGSKSY